MNSVNVEWKFEKYMLIAKITASFKITQDKAMNECLKKMIIEQMCKIIEIGEDKFNGEALSVEPSFKLEPNSIGICISISLKSMEDFNVFSSTAQNVIKRGM